MKPTARVIASPPTPAETLALTTPLCVGFGSVTVTHDGKCVWAGDDENILLRRFELLARKNPGDWRVEFYAPLSGSVYHRETRDRWVLVSTNGGFA